MSEAMRKPSLNSLQKIDVCIGDEGTPVGSLTYVQQGQRENTSFAYAATWLASREKFKISPDLELISDYQQRKASTKVDSPFHYAFADTAPDAWGRRVIARAHAKQRRSNPQVRALTELDYLTAVDDHSRVGALRLRDAEGKFVGQSLGRFKTPPLIDLPSILNASRAVENGTETLQDLRYLQGKGTSLGGMRPKCTIVDTNDRLAIGKFPSSGDSRSVTRGEVLVMRLAHLAGINVAPARIQEVDGIPVAIIGRFDRTAEGKRIPYLSAASMLQASREEDRSYVEIADVIRSQCAAPIDDLRALWRRIVFNLLVNNVDDHLQNHGFLYVGNTQWALAPAFDLNPFPDKERASKTWLSEQDGPIVDIEMLLGRCDYFALSKEQANRVFGEVSKAVNRWKALALSNSIGLKAKELDDFSPAFICSG
jgi:serine/threonine-protein kinase HipA